MSLAKALAPLVDLVFPPRCPLCGEGIGAQTGLCPACWSDLVIPGEPACVKCGRPFAEGIPEGATCAPCLGEPPRHNGIAAATLYNDASRKLVLALKHGNRISLAPMMAGLMTPKLAFVDADWLIVPVPLHRWRIWKRGFNQAAELGRHIARRTGARLAVDALARGKATPSLGGLGKKARKRMLSGAIKVRPGRAAMLRGASVILVDDVLTSGATSNACVSALKRAGAGKVIVACFARVLDEALDGP
ncbi:ComF family protein [Novosphingobium mangrovi (ex Huang et al. 2023)]|uniref:ComF family protein n=1 Tax=Novosphingobium mangrovi (ex Huang et al. 2023) TaxID=2976432 RepID=A0ABT2I7G7_9SPHN|nr:ComF family protein [Novosphingobium mangrovi (ex Huang et al. 2023)]MCT2400765.1 ComF family protein [Novosphingobium mangrovi (ex Huang et al. 2023)]